MAKIDPAKVRNVGVVGHGGVGKTMLIEQILHNAGVTSRLGTIEEKNTVCDYLDEEQDRQHTITMSLVHFEQDGARIHMIDHPGYSDFLGEEAASSALVDGMVIVVDAASGVAVGTDNAWKYAEKFGVPRAFFVNKLDRDNTNFEEIVSELQATYGSQCVPLVIPVGSQADLSAAVNIIDGDTSAVADEAEAMKESMVEAVAEADDELLEKYFEEGELTPEEFTNGLQAGVTAGKIVPIIAGSVSKDVGTKELVDIIARYFPSPLKRKVVDADGNEVKVGASEPFVGQVFRSIVDPFVGQLTLFRVLTGTLKSDSDFLNVSTSSKERTGKIYMMNGKEQTQVSEVGPGDIAALTKLKNTHFGNTIAAAGVTTKMPAIELPAGMVKLAINPKSRSDEDKIGEALNRLAEEDPTFQHYRDEATGEHVIRGVGDLQLNILLDRMKNKYHVEAETQVPKVAYRETVRGKSEVQGKHKKQTGGHGQYGDVHLRISPNERGAGYEFVDGIVGGVVPKQYIPHVDKGCQDALLRGVISGNPVVDVKVELFFGSYHNVDSSEMAFKIAASLAIRKGIVQAQPILLEPIMEIAVTVPEEFMGDINGDLTSRRGRILGMDPAGGNKQIVRASVPEAEVLRYSTDLRSMTQDRGTFEMHFDHYAEVPDHVAKEVIAAYEKSKEEDN